MNELFCPYHGIPAIVIGFFVGDVSILHLTILMFRVKLSEIVERIKL